VFVALPVLGVTLCALVAKANKQRIAMNRFFIFD